MISKEQLLEKPAENHKLLCDVWNFFVFYLACFSCLVTPVLQQFDSKVVKRYTYKCDTLQCASLMSKLITIYCEAPTCENCCKKFKNTKGI